MKKNDKLIWSLIAALGLMVVIAGVMLLRSYNTNKSNQRALTELEANLSSVSSELAQTTSDREALKTQVQSMTQESEQAAQAAQDLKERYDTASASLEDQKKQIDSLNAQIAKLQSDQEAANTRSAAEQKKLSEALTEAQANLAAAQQEKEALNQSITALNEQSAAAQSAAEEQQDKLNAQIKALQNELDAVKTTANKDAEKSAVQVTNLSTQLKKAQEDLAAASRKTEALEKTVDFLNEQLNTTKSTAVKDAAQSAAQLLTLNEQLAKAQEDLTAASQKEATLSQTITDLNEQLTAAKSAADKDAKQSVAQIASLNERLTNAQTQLNAVRKEKEEQDQAVAALNEQLAAAKESVVSSAKQSAAQAASLTNQLNEAKAQLDTAQKEKETLKQSIAALNEQLAATQAAAGKNAQESAAQVAALNEQLSQAQADLKTARTEKDTLDKAVASLNEQLGKAQTDLTAAGKEKTALDETVASLKAQLAAAEKNAAENKAALNGKLKETQTELAQTQAALAKADAENASAVAALEQKNQVLTEETQKLNASLEEETQKAARLQEELNVQSAQPEALQKRLEGLTSEEKTVAAEELEDLVIPILRAFRESIPADPEDGTTYPVPVSVLIGGQEAMTISYNFTKAQEAKAYEAAKEVNDSQTLYQIDLNREKTAALIVNGTAFDKAAFESVYAEIFPLNPAASRTELNQLTAEAMTKKQVLQEHAEAMGLDTEDADMESKLWEEALKNVKVSEADFSAALQQRQTEEDAMLASDPNAYARMLEEGRIASPVLPEGSRFIKQLIVSVDTSELNEIVPELERLQKKLDAVNAKLENRSLSGFELEKLQKERDLFAKQVSQLYIDRKLMLAIEQRTLDQAADLASKIRTGQLTFEEAVDLATRDDAMPATGYAVFSGASVPSEEWAAAALALKEPGDASEPIRLSDGYHVLYYSEEITSASAVVQSAHETLTQDLLSALRDATKESLLNQWISEAKVVLNAK